MARRHRLPGFVNRVSFCVRVSFLRASPTLRLAPLVRKLVTQIASVRNAVGAVSPSGSVRGRLGASVLF